MARYKITLEFDGTRYYGWQAQKGSRTVQGEFLTVFDKLFPGENVEFYGAGRTDSGVHALNQTAHLNMASEMPDRKLLMKINDLLPTDIHVLQVERVNPRFHARHDAIARSYIYLISKRRTAFEKAHCWWIRDPLNVAVMREVAGCMTGMHDFRSFTEQSTEEGSTKVEILFMDIHEEGDLIAVHITGSHFLWKMVRRITGTLVEAGRGRFQLNDILEMLNGYSDIPARFTAPPSGLFLHRVYYPGDQTHRGREYMPGLLNFRVSSEF
jgi:tRNA pseudouridine38-40 synthase